VPIYRGHGLTLLFLHVPKTGGSSIEVLLRRAGFSEGLWSNRQRDARHGVYPQHLTAADLVARLPGETIDLAFLVCRNPVARLASERAYRDRLRRDRGRPALPGYDEWAGRVLTKALRNRKRFDNHLRPQVDYLLPSATVYRFEDGLDSVRAGLAEQTGVTAFDELTMPRVQSGAPEGERPFSSLSRATVQAFLDLYLPDFGAFNYELPGEVPAPRVASRMSGQLAETVANSNTVQLGLRV
jgi:hypothetical protein